MTNQKKPPPPRVEVIRRPASTTPAQPAGPTPSPVAPRPSTPTPAPTPTPARPAAAAPVPPTPRPAVPSSPASPAPAPRPAVPVSRPVSSGLPGPIPSATPGAPGAPGAPPRAPGFGADRGGFRPGGPPGPGGKRFAPRGPPRPPPTVEQINALAKKERVPARIAKGDLEGKMKCRIWRKLHAEEAKRFDDAYTLMEKHPELDLADAFAVVQSGRTVAEFLQKKARGKLKAEIKEARNALPGDAVDTWLQAMIDGKDELSVTLGDRTIVDRLVQNQPVAFVFERAGRIEKLQVVVMARKDHWDRVNVGLERDSKLTRKPVAVQRQPDRRPVADPRAFVPSLERPIRVETRNGIVLVAPLIAVGPFDVLLGEKGQELFVPLHAMLRWGLADGSDAPPAPAS